MTTVQDRARTTSASTTSAPPVHHPATRAERTRVLFQLAAHSSTEDERRDLMATVIEMHLDLAYGQASRYRSRGVDLDDLRQVAALGLIKAARGYDVAAGHDFLSYAMPTVRGELRRHFRDKGWMIRPPRRIQELQAHINAAGAELTQALGHAPRPDEIAEHLQEPFADVMEAMATSGCFEPTSLDRPASAEDPRTIGELLSDGRLDYLAAEARLMLDVVLGELPARERQILHLRFVRELTQVEIGSRLGISQMQVSRIISRVLNQLRHAIGDTTRDQDPQSSPPPPAPTGTRWVHVP